MDEGGGTKRNVKIQLRAPTFRNKDDNCSNTVQDLEGGSQGNESRAETKLKRRPKSLAFEENDEPRRKSNFGVHPASPSHGPRHSLGASTDARNPYASGSKSPRASASQLQLQHLLPCIDVETETYGFSELRDGFFDASFYRPLTREIQVDDAKERLPAAFRRYHPLSLRRFLPQQWQEFKDFLCQLQRSGPAIRMLKAFLGFFIAYIICLIPKTRDWLGKYNYVMAISSIINHAGRPVGSQIDGAIMTVLGTIIGLGWGSVALYVSTSTRPARSGYGGVLATFLVIFSATIAWLRSMYMRFYQAVLCAGIAICYTCLADTSESVGWRKVFNYGIPWLFGQALCLAISICVFPDTGSRSLALAFHDSLEIVQKGLVVPRQNDRLLRRELALTFVKLSGAVRDFTLEVTASRYLPDDSRILRNLIQGVIRSVLSIRTETILFEMIDDNPEAMAGDNESAEKESLPQVGPSPPSHEASLSAICSLLASPTRELIEAMKSAIQHVDMTLAEIGGIAFSHATFDSYHENLSQAHELLQSAIHAFDAADRLLIQRQELRTAYANNDDIIDIFLFVHPVRQTADKVQDLLRKALEVQHQSKHWRINLPTYPFHKSLNRVNAQVRHDRGGMTAGFYFRTKQQIEKTIADFQSSTYVPRRRSVAPGDDEEGPVSKTSLPGNPKSGLPLRQTGQSAIARYRFLLWRILHRLQDFESRFAFKVALVTTLLSIPAWLQQSRGWWNDYESWWTVVTVWMMMHPRVGGTFQDLWTRSLCAFLGAAWAAFGWAAGHGNPYVLGSFAVIFMFPMLHRFTQSYHPRSGVVGCFSFTVISLGAYTNDAQPNIISFAGTRGAAFLVGVFAALLTNWILWPFIARHEMRKSLSTMILHSAILYRGVVARYIYYADHDAPGPADIERSEMLEGRLREGLVRIRQLLELTRHEIRLRAPFDPIPYNCLIDACAHFFEHLVEVRQSSIFFQPFMQARGADAANALFEVRRDAVAVILFNLYALGSALRADQPVPRYLPSAAAARQKLLERMEVVEAEYQEKESQQVNGVEPRAGTGRRWADVYQYAFSSALTDIVEELQMMQKWTKEICGETTFGSDIVAGVEKEG